MRLKVANARSKEMSKFIDLTKRWASNTLSRSIFCKTTEALHIIGQEHPGRVEDSSGLRNQ